VIKTIQYGLSLIKNKLRDIGTGVKRSPHWKTVEKDFIKKHPFCAACGTTMKLQVHHIVPFHIAKNLELDPSNLITLCMSVKECHYLIGHHDSWKDSNPNVVADAERVLKNPELFEKIATEIRAKKNIAK
jgi:hypothetical protein